MSAKTIDRLMVTFIFAGVLVIGLVILSRTGFADTVSSADLTFAESWIAPMRQVAGTLLISVPAVLLIQEIWQRTQPAKVERIPRRSNQD